MITENKVQVQLQLHLQGQRSACTEKSCDTSKFQEFWNKCNGDTWKWCPWVWNLEGGGWYSLKGHQVQIFKKCIFELLCTEKVFQTSCEVKIRSRSPKVIKCKFSSMLRKCIADIMCKISSFGKITFYKKYIPFPRPTYGRKIDFLQSVKFKTSVGATRGF